MKNVAAAALAALLFGAAGCTNFNYPVGVQQFGSVTGRLVDQTTQQPVGGAGVNVSCAGQATHPDSSGAFTISGIPIGQQTCTIDAIGYAPASPQVTIVQGQTAQLGIIQLTPSIGAPSGG